MASALTLCWAWPWRTKEMVCVDGVGGAAVFRVAALAWLARRPEDNIAVVAHGGLLAVTFDPEGHGGHSCVAAPKACTKRFSNCEVRTVTLVTEDGGARFSVRSG